MARPMSRLEILQSIGIIAGLLTSAYTIRKEGDVRRIQNLFALTKNHREIWTEVLNNRELVRILSISPDLKRNPVTEAERLFVLFLILHLASSYEARKRGMFFSEAGLRRDIRQFFDLPIPRQIWQEFKKYQRPDFVSFVEMNCNPIPA